MCVKFPCKRLTVSSLIFHYIIMISVKSPLYRTDSQFSYNGYEGIICFVTKMLSAFRDSHVYFDVFPVHLFCY